MYQLTDLKGKTLPWTVYAHNNIEGFDGVFSELKSLPAGIVGHTECGLVEVIVDSSKIESGKPIRRTPMKIGKALNKAGFSSSECQEISNKFNTNMALMRDARFSLTESPEHVVQVYKDGPTSCMSDMDCVRVYHSTDVRVAYVEIKGRIVARSVVCVNPELGLQYTEVYGNERLLKRLLEDAGYAQGSLEGCKVPKITEGGLVVLPYLDSVGGFSDYGDCLLLTDSYEEEGKSTNGLAGFVCAECNDVHGNDERNYSEHNEESICDSCFNETHVLVNGQYYHKDSSDISELHTGEYILSTDAVETHEGDIYHIYDVSYAEYDEEYAKHDEVILAFVEEDKEEYCLLCNTTRADDGTLCHDDYLDEYELYLEGDEDED